MFNLVISSISLKHKYFAFQPLNYIIHRIIIYFELNINIRFRMGLPQKANLTEVIKVL